MPFTTYWWNEILDHIFDKGAYAAPTIHVGLSRADPGYDAGGLDEPSGSGYARVATAAGDWNAASGRLTDNANPITFPAPSGSWGTPTHLCLFDAAAAGNLLAYGALTNVQAVTAGSTPPSFAAGELDVRGA